MATVALSARIESFFIKFYYVVKKHQSDTDSPNRTKVMMVKDIILVWLLCNIVINTIVLVKYFVLILKPFIANTAYPPKC